MNLIIIHEEVRIPTRCPFNVTFLREIRGDEENKEVRKCTGQMKQLRQGEEEFIKKNLEGNIICEHNFLSYIHFLWNSAALN